MEFLVTARFGENTVNTTAEHFIATFLEKFRLLDELTLEKERLPDSVKMMMIQTAVSPIEDLRYIKSIIEVHGTPDDYQQYLTLLTKAAVTFDRSKEKNKPTSHINVIDQYSPYDDFYIDIDNIDTREGEIDGGNDMDAKELLLNKAKQFQRNPKNFPPKVTFPFDS